MIGSGLQRGDRRDLRFDRRDRRSEHGRDTCLRRRWARSVVDERSRKRGRVIRLRQDSLDLLQHVDQAEDVVLVDVAEQHPSQRHRLVALAERLEARLQGCLPDALRSPVDDRVARVRRGAVVKDQCVAVKRTQRFELEHHPAPVTSASNRARRQSSTCAGSTSPHPSSTYADTRVSTHAWCKRRAVVPGARCSRAPNVVATFALSAVICAQGSFS